MKLLLVSASLVLCASCRTIATSSVSSAAAPVVRVGARARTWELRCGEERLGLVVLFQEKGRARDSLYVVRNLWHQDLGLIDGLGRAYRYLPHHEEPAWVGSGTVLAGAQRILGTTQPCELVEVRETELRPVPGTIPAQAPAARDDEPDPPTHAPADAPPPDGGLPQSA